MFDDPGKKLTQLKDELLEVEDAEDENFAADFDDTAYDDEEFDESSAVLAEETKRPGLRTLVFLLVVGVLIAGAGWWLGWF